MENKQTNKQKLFLFKCNMEKKKKKSTEREKCYPLLSFSCIYNASSLLLTTSGVYSPYFQKPWATVKQKMSKIWLMHSIFLALSHHAYDSSLSIKDYKHFHLKRIIA